MIRRTFITLLGGAATWPLAARAQQQAGKVWRVGMLETVSATLNAANFNAFTRVMRDLGYVERENLVIEYRSADGSAERFPDLANELVRLSVDLIVTRGTPAALAAKKATTTIPIVMAASGEPLGSGLVASLAQPGGNLTGLSALTSDTYSKRVELLKEIVPRAVRIVALLSMSNPVHVSEWSEIEKATLRLGLVSQLSDIRKRQQIEPAFDTASRQRADALLVANGTLTQSNRRLIVELAAKHRLPAMYAAREFIDAGGLIAYTVSYPDLYRRAATYVDKIFKGAKPANLPVEQPTKFDLIINLKTAKALGLTVPLIMQMTADEVIE
jgi:putative ABC transport system substrate-binding protein